MGFARNAFALCTALVLSSSAIGQAPPEPTAEHKKLEAAVGRWEATVKAGGSESKGTSNNVWGPGKLYVVSNFRGEMGGAKFEGHGIDGYDPATKKYFSVWVDSMSTKPLNFEGTMDAGGKVLTMTAEGPGEGGKTMKYKSVTEFNSPETMNFKLFMVNGGSETQLIGIDYKKLPPRERGKGKGKAKADPAQ